MGIKVRVEEKFNDRSKLAKKLTARRERLSKEMSEQKEDEIEKSLEEIYQDSDGERIDVERMKIRKRQGLVFWFFNILVFGLIAIVLVGGSYYYITYGKGTDAMAVSLNVESRDAVSAGEEFTYTINYNNQEYVALKNVGLKVSYPEDFIFISADPEPSLAHDSWNLGRVDPRSGRTLKIKGKMIAKAGTAGIILAQLTYTPENFSSEFKKDNSFTTVVKDIGFDVGFDYSDTALVNQIENVVIDFKPLEADYLPEFTISLQKDSNIQILETVVNRGAPAKENGNSLKVEKNKDEKNDIWSVSGLQKKEEMMEIKYRVKNKTADTQNLKFSFSEKVGSTTYVFLEKTLPISVMKSDLNLALIMNGARTDLPVDFGQKLNYSIAYSNKGEASMKDVVIMAVLDSNFLDWTSLEDKNKGQEMGNTLTWTKNEIPALGKIDVGEQGNIDFSISVLPFKESDLGKDFKILSYAQYIVGGLDQLNKISSSSVSSTAASVDNRSNTLESTINSDLGFKEQVRYFDENNLPVGDGPLPPQVGQRTSFKVYWSLTNNLHDLNDVQVVTTLPNGVTWDLHSRTSVGTISYDNVKNTVTWQIGRLPITVFRADAEFNIALTPSEDARNKLMVLVSGSKIMASDLKTGASLEKNSSAKTTKLEDDEIANMSSDGRVK